jgi:hypothetical protein
MEAVRRLVRKYYRTIHPLSCSASLPIPSHHETEPSAAEITFKTPRTAFERFDVAICETIIHIRSFAKRSDCLIRFSLCSPLQKLKQNASITA